MIGIYKITNPKGKIYIGQSIDVDRRRRVYKTMKCDRQFKIYSSLKKYGWDNHKFEVIHECQEEELNDLEVYYIDLYQSFNSEFGLNLNSGGGNRRHSEETKIKIRKALKGRKMSEEQKKKLSEAWKTRVVSKETRKKVSLALSKRIHTEESKLKASLSHKKRFSDPRVRLSISGENASFYGKKHTEENKKILSEIAKNRPSMSKETREKIGLSSRIKINQYTTEGVFIREWDSIVGASADLKIDASYIAKVCNGKHKQAKGFIFKHAGFSLSQGMRTTLGGYFNNW